MTQTTEFYEARADEAASEAESAALENVRQRALRSEGVWRDLAERARQVAVERTKRDRAQAERTQSEGLPTSAAVIEI